MTLKEIAAIAHVSPASVSLVLNNKPGVSDAKRQEIQALLQKYQYGVPKAGIAIARQLLFLKYMRNGLVVEKNTGFVASILDAIEAECRSLQYTLRIEVCREKLADYIQQAEEQFEELTEYMERLESIIDEQQNQFGKLEQRIMLIEGRLNEILPSVEIDYDELSTAIELYNKYHGRIDRPVVLEKTNYTNDYCFRVSGIDEEEETLTGRYYRKGKLYGQQTTFPFSTRCRMFNGDTLEDVIAGEI